MARIKAQDDSRNYWYLETGQTYVWTENESHATDMPRIYANKKLEDLLRAERWRNAAERRIIKIVRSKLP